MAQQPPAGAGKERSRPPATAHGTEVLLGGGDLVVGLGVAGVALAAYVVTLAPGLLPADVAEFQTLAVTLGYAHPSGYPVYLLLAKLATAIPVADVPYRVNLFSAIMGAVAAAGVYLLGRVLTGRRWLPVAGGLALAVSPTFWSQAIIAEVYTSGVVCMVGVLLGLALWQQTGHARWLFAGACVGGVSLGVHTTHALLAPAALLVLILTPRRWKANWTAAVSGALTGLAITLAAFALIDRADSRTSYFRTVIYPSRSLWQLGPEDVDGFWDRVRLSISPPQYKGLLFSKPWEVTEEKAAWYFGNLPNEFPPLWLAAAAVGLCWLGRRNPKMTLLLGLSYATHLFFDLFYDMGGIHVLYLATYVPIAVFGVAGLAWASDGLRAVAPRLGKGRSAAAAFDSLTGLLGLGVVIWPMLFPAAWTEDRRRACWLPPDERDAPGVERSAEFHRQVRALIDDLEPDAVLFTGWDLVYPYYYVAHVEKDRTDLVFIQDYPHPYHFELADSAVRYVKRVSADRPVYFTHQVRKVAELFEMQPVRRGPEKLYRVGRPLRGNTE